MAEQPRSQFDIDPIGRVGKQIGAQDPQDRLEQGDRDQADHQHIECAHAAMHEHLVDHDLEEQRRHQRKELEKERGDQHFAQQAAVLMDRAQEPGDVEPARQIGEGRPFRHQHEPAIPHGFELGPGHHRRSLAIRRLDDDLVVTGLAEQQKAPVAQDGYSGQWRTGKPLPRSLQATGFEVESLRAAEHLGDTDRCSAELMTDLRGIDPDPLKTQEHDQGGKTRIK